MRVDRGLDEVERPAEIGLNITLPLFGRDLTDADPCGRARIVDKNVELPERLDERPDRRRHIVDVADIEGERRELLLRQLRGQPCNRLLGSLEVDDADRGTPPRQSGGDRKADALRGTRDHGSLVREQIWFHDSPSTEMTETRCGDGATRTARHRRPKAPMPIRRQLPRPDYPTPSRSGSQFEIAGM